MTIVYHPEVEQGSDLWMSLRTGILTASEMKLIVTPKKLEIVKNPSHLYEILSQRISGYVEPHYINDDMIRGHEDEVEAKIKYAENYAPVTDTGFITNDKFGFTIGYSPDGLVGDGGAIECKSRNQALAVEAIIKDAVPDEHRIQVQTGLLVSERKWIDYVSYSGGFPMMVKRVYPDETVQNAILLAAAEFNEKLEDLLYKYHDIIEEKKYVKTERRKPIEEEDITV
jgi:hypothetical protein